MARLLKRRPRQPDVLGPTTPSSSPPSTTSTTVGPAIFLLPMKSGIWTLCAAVSGKPQALGLQRRGEPGRGLFAEALLLASRQPATARDSTAKRSCRLMAATHGPNGVTH